MARNDEKKNIRCSFCGKHQDQVRRLIAGPGVYICNECVQLCMGILDDNYEPVDEPGSSGMPDVIPTPQEIHRAGSIYHRPGAGQDRPVRGRI